MKDFQLGQAFSSFGPFRFEGHIKEKTWAAL